MSVFHKLVLTALASLLIAAPAIAAERAIIILDGSGSMWAQIRGEARITIARETLREVLYKLPRDLELGFMTYGHRYKGDCDDIELLIEPGPDNAEEISEAADDIVPKGKTPISAAVRVAAEYLNYTEDEATVILITDGIETCYADPCGLASELESRGIDFTTHVIGFGLSDEEGVEVSCLAENTGGLYLQAEDADELADAMGTMTDVMVEDEPVAEPEAEPAPEPEPVADAPDYNIDPSAVMAEGEDELGENTSVVWEFYEVNADDSKGERVATEYGGAWRGTLDPGVYILRAGVDYAYVEQKIRIVEGEVAEPYFVLDGGTLIIHPRPSEDADVDTGAPVYMAFPNGESTTSYGDTTLVVPAGDTEVTVTIGSGEMRDTVTVVAGATVERDFVVGVGRAAINAYYVEDMVVEDGGLVVEIFNAKKAIDGNRKLIVTAYGPNTGHDLPPGDYVAVLTMGEASAETPFSVGSGELTEVNAILEAGVLAISAPGAASIELFSAKKDIQGKRKSLGVAYAEEAQFTLPAGDYSLLATIDDGEGTTKEADASVTAGERTELSID